MMVPFSRGYGVCSAIRIGGSRAGGPRRLYDFHSVVKFHLTGYGICNNRQHDRQNVLSNSSKPGGTTNTETVCRRRVLEIGSGSIKCQVSDVNIQTRHIVRNLAATNKTVLFTRDLTMRKKLNIATSTNEKNGEDIFNRRTYVRMPVPTAFSSSIQEEGIQAIERILTDTDIFQPDVTVAVATEAFRQASNGHQFASALKAHFNMPVFLVSAQREAQCGFQTAAAVTGLPTTELISWDCGAGSFQLATLSCGSHEDSHGSGTVELLARPLRERGMSSQHIVDTLLRTLRQELLVPIPDSLQTAINDPTYQIIAIGSQHSIFNQQRIVSGNQSFSQDDVENSLRKAVALEHIHRSKLVKWEMDGSQRLVGADDDDRDEKRCIDNAMFLVPKLALLLAVMQHSNIRRVVYHKTNGNCPALLTQQTLWE